MYTILGSCRNHPLLPDGAAASCGNPPSCVLSLLNCDGISHCSDDTDENFDTCKYVRNTYSFAGIIYKTRSYIEL